MIRLLTIALAFSTTTNILTEDAFAIDLDPRNVPVCAGMSEGQPCTKVNGHPGKCTINPCTNQLACIYEQEIAAVKEMCK